MNEIDELIEQILEIKGVDDVLKLSDDGGMKLLDGRTLVPLNVYLRIDQGETLGIKTGEVIKAGDHFGGKR